ncbi:MAG: hypothetical protein JWN40_2649 [Phycisphaerales bacterium]|nr:hypothetical protein [Phycisphaerales bacterium]
MRMTWIGLLLIVTATGGCSSYTASQAKLAEQARKGVAVWVSRETARDEEVKRTYTLKRAALDSAFDADARQRTALDADWVIEARRGYAAGLGALAQAESAALSANEAARRDAAATDAALEKLVWLLSIQSGFESLFEKGGAR